jgi:dihydrofolate reductase
VIRLIAAIDSRRGIATDNGIPWKIPADSAYFRRQTMAGLIVMGSATYREFAEPLHGRDNYVLTHSHDPLRPGFQPIGALADLPADRDVWVIGGAGVYAGTIDGADELYLTQVLGDFGCTKFFPPYEDRFELAGREPDASDDGFTFRFERWKRRSG